MNETPAPNEYEPLLDAALLERAPLPLREQIERDRGRLAVRGAVSRRLRATGILAAAAAIVGVVVGLAVPSGASGPTVLDVAALGVKPALAAAPAPRRSHPETLEAGNAGVRFPAWGTSLRWTPSGYRSDELDGRDTETVFYRSVGGARLGYTIVDGAALPWPKGSRTVVRRGVAVRLVRARGRLVAAWRVKGRTCVITAPATMSERKAVALASVSSYP